jgi:2-C-methyl-D-erythritol 4-phosphate cytidylyltransferase
MKVVVVIPAAGTGSRIGGPLPKQYLKISGKEIIAHTIEKFNSCREVDRIIIAAEPGHFVRLSAIIRKHKLRKAKTIVEGGKTRQQSVFNALKVSGCESGDIVLVHDSVRPFVSGELIRRTIMNAKKYKCALPVMPVSDTVKMIGKNGVVKETIDRNAIVTAQTPQGFRFETLYRAFEKADAKRFAGTDESSVAEFAGSKVKTFPGESRNIKITLREDLKRTGRIKG